MSLKPHCRPLCTDIGTTASPCVETKPSSGFATEWFIPLLGRDLKNGPVPPPASSTRKDLQGDAVEWLGHALYGICTLTTQAYICTLTHVWPHTHIPTSIHSIHICTRTQTSAYSAHMHICTPASVYDVHTHVHTHIYTQCTLIFSSSCMPHTCTHTVMSM